MSHLTRIISFILLILCAVTQQSIARVLSSDQNTEQTFYLKVDYFKATGPQISEYLDVELDLWKPIHQERFNRGIIKSWDFYSVVAGGHDIPYNYIAVNVFDDFEMIDYFDLENIVQAVYPGMNPGEMLERTRKSREVVRTEIWKVNKRILSDGRYTPGGRYITISYFNETGDTSQLVDMKKKLKVPALETRIDRNTLDSWTINTLLFPDGKAREYSYCTIEYYENLGDLREAEISDLAEIAHPDLSEEDTFDYFSTDFSIGKLIKTELWKRIGHVGPVEN